MAKGSVRKKGKKWYYRFYVEDATGRLIQKEYVGTESKSETEKLLRKAMEEYENTKIVANSENITLAMLLDNWADEELKTGPLSNGTVQEYLHAIKRFKDHPLSSRKISSVTSEQLQAFVDLIVFGGKEGNFDAGNGYTRGYAVVFSAILNHAFRYAITRKKILAYNPMKEVKVKRKKITADPFLSEDEYDENAIPLTPEMFNELIAYMEKHHPESILAVQISYYTGLRVGEVSGLTWQDIDLESQQLTVRRSVGYNSVRHKTEIGPTKRGKIRVVPFGDKLTEILKAAKAKQKFNEKTYGNLYQRCYYKEVLEKNRNYYEYYSLNGTQEVPEDYHSIDFVCRRDDGSLMRSFTLNTVCKKISEKLQGFEDFHFHLLRHTFTTNLIQSGASPKDVQEMLGHSDIGTTMNWYAHGTKDTKRSSVKMLDQLTG